MISPRKTCFVLLSFCFTVALIAAPVMAHGHKRSADCLFQFIDVSVQVDDLDDGVVLTMTSDDEEVATRLQEIAWAQVEQDEDARKHDCFFQMVGVQVLVNDLHDGVILTITSTNEETVARLQETARRATKNGCRHHRRCG